jgi:sensor histidine kinase YesM
VGFFSFIITLVLISTAAKIIERRRRPTLPGESVQVDTEELHRIAETITDLSERVERLEEERDFYKDLLEPPSSSRELPPPD